MTTARLTQGKIVPDLRDRVYDKLQRLSFRFFDVHGSSSIFNRVTGDVQGKGTRSILVRNGTWVDGNVQLTEGSASSRLDALLVRNATVIGDVQAEKSRGRLRALGNRIGGNLQFVENRRGPYAIRNNQVREDLQFFKNYGTGAITENQVGGNLQSKENSPSPVVKRNTVEGDLELE
jgi:hypothetical protein